MVIRSYNGVVMRSDKLVVIRSVSRSVSIRAKGFVSHFAAFRSLFFGQENGLSIFWPKKSHFPRGLLPHFGGYKVTLFSANGCL